MVTTAPAPGTRTGAAAEPVFTTRPIIWPLSAADEPGLRARGRALGAAMLEDPGLDLVRAGAALAAEPGAPSHRHRAVLLAGGPAELRTALGALAEGSPAAGLFRAQAGPPVEGAVLVFPGQGSQWPGMAAELAAASPVFRDSLMACDAALAPWVDRSLLDVLGLDGEPDEAALERVDVLQPALFAVMVSLGRLWRACGVPPAAVIGHSQGEIAAACVAGALSLADAARISAQRGHTLVALSGRGCGMVSVPRPREWVEERVARDPARVALAALNGPGTVVVSGDLCGLREIVDDCAAEGYRARMIKVDYASHSPQVEVVRDEVLAGLAGVDARSAAVPYYSAVTGGRIDTAELGAPYWYENLRRMVRFDEAVRAAHADGHRYFLEVSPHPLLTGPLRRTLDAAAGPDAGPPALVLRTLKRGEDHAAGFLAALAAAWVGGLDVDWSAVLS